MFYFILLVLLRFILVLSMLFALSAALPVTVVPGAGQWPLAAMCPSTRDETIIHPPQEKSFFSQCSQRIKAKNTQLAWCIILPCLANQCVNYRLLFITAYGTVPSPTQIREILTKSADPFLPAKRISIRQFQFPAPCHLLLSHRQHSSRTRAKKKKSP